MSQRDRGMTSVSICIPTYNNGKTIIETLASCRDQFYPIKEIVVCDDCSTDNTVELVQKFSAATFSTKVTLHCGVNNQGIGPNIKRCIEKATGDVIIFMCGDDMFAERKVISDAADLFAMFPGVGYVSRWYYQYMNGYPGKVRIHRTMDPFFQADNPSGLAFRREALLGVRVSTDIFVEAASMVKYVLDHGWGYKFLCYDTIAVRIHPGGNTATVKSYYKSSPTMSWYNLIGPNKNLLTAFISFIQLKNWATYPQLLKEIWLFIKLRPINLLRPDFYMFALIALLTPKRILRPFTNFYKHRLSRIFLTW